MARASLRRFAKWLPTRISARGSGCTFHRTGVRLESNVLGRRSSSATGTLHSFQGPRIGSLETAPCADHWSNPRHCEATLEVCDLFGRDDDVDDVPLARNARPLPRLLEVRARGKFAHSFVSGHPIQSRRISWRPDFWTAFREDRPAMEHDCGLGLDPRHDPRLGVRNTDGDTRDYRIRFAGGSARRMGSHSCALERAFTGPDARTIARPLLSIRHSVCSSGQLD